MQIPANPNNGKITIWQVLIIYQDRRSSSSNHMNHLRIVCKCQKCFHSAVFPYRTSSGGKPPHSNSLRRSEYLIETSSLRHSLAFAFTEFTQNNNWMLKVPEISRNYIILHILHGGSCLPNICYVDR